MSKYSPRNMLITGGAGFIGSNFIRFTLAHRPRVHIINVDALTYAGNEDNLKQLPDPQRYEFIQGDINDKALIENLLQKYDINTVINFAAESHVDRSIDAPTPFIQTNIVGTFNLLDCAHRFWKDTKSLDPETCRFHQISTDEVFGSLEANELAFRETTPYLPNSPYSATKAGADHLVRAYHETYGLPATISYCSNNYGPYQHREKLIPTIIRCCLSQKPIPIYGDGSNIRDWIYVEDHCRGILTVIKHGLPGETYNIGGNNEWSNLAIAEYICEVMDELYPHKTPYRELIQFTDDRPGHDFRYAIDNAKLTQQTEWQPETSFADGIRNTIQFYVKRHEKHGESDPII